MLGFFIPQKAHSACKINTYAICSQTLFILEVIYIMRASPEVLRKYRVAYARFKKAEEVFKGTAHEVLFGRVSADVERLMNNPGSRNDRVITHVTMLLRQVYSTICASVIQDEHRPQAPNVEGVQAKHAELDEFAGKLYLLSNRYLLQERPAQIIQLIDSVHNVLTHLEQKMRAEDELVAHLAALAVNAPIEAFMQPVRELFNATPPAVQQQVEIILGNIGTLYNEANQNIANVLGEQPRALPRA